jgi:hypothetical protein
MELKKRNHKTDKFVITCKPEGPGSLYFGENGKPTRWSHAAEFPTKEGAKRFARRLAIKIDSKTVSIVVKRHTPTPA